MVKRISCARHSIGNKAGLSASSLCLDKSTARSVPVVNGDYVLMFASIAVGAGLAIILVFGPKTRGVIEPRRRDKWLQDLLSRSRTQESEDATKRNQPPSQS